MIDWWYTVGRDGLVHPVDRDNRPLCGVSLLDHPLYETVGPSTCLFCLTQQYRIDRLAEN